MYATFPGFDFLGDRTQVKKEKEKFVVAWLLPACMKCEISISTA